MTATKFKLGDLLVQYNYINEEDLEKALQYQQDERPEMKLGEILVELDLIKESHLLQVLEFHLGFPHVELSKYILDPQMAELLPENLARRAMAIPLEKHDRTLKVALADPSDVVAIDDISRATGLRVEPFIASSQDIRRALNELYFGTTGEEEVFQKLDEFETDQEEEDIELEELQQMVEDAPIVRLANLVINRAIQERASDVHIEPLERQVKIRYRLDGILTERMTVPKGSQAALISRMKIMANLDISERRKPQDGRINLKRGDTEWDIRVSVLPTIFGEKVVIRLLNRQSIPTLSALGFGEENERIIRQMIKNPNGMILVTGPTGSGKTTTLFSAMREVNSPNVNITTVEDPVEYVLAGVNQVQSNSKIGLTFANALRSILRQDPDIIMIGEIRDSETANIGINSALTGHLVLSTLHTNDAPSAISRLMDMGAEPFLIASTLIGIMAQRLVRKLCSECKTEIPLSEEQQAFLAEHGIHMKTQYAGEGCKACGDTGFRGRIAISEILVVDREIRRLIVKRRSIDEIRQMALDRGMKTLLGDGLEKFKNGDTTLEEVLRVAVQ